MKAITKVDNFSITKKKEKKEVFLLHDFHPTGEPRKRNNQSRREQHCFTRQGTWTYSHTCGALKQDEFMLTSSLQPYEKRMKESHLLRLLRMRMCETKVTQKQP
jgi:hypothetical protein